MSCRFNFSDRSLIAILLYLYAMAVKYEYIGKIYFKICFKNRLLMRMKKVNQLFYEKTFASFAKTSWSRIIFAANQCLLYEYNDKTDAN